MKQLALIGLIVVLAQPAYAQGVGKIDGRIDAKFGARVQSPAPTDGQVLKYDASSAVWKAGTPSGPTTSNLTTVMSNTPNAGVTGGTSLTFTTGDNVVLATSGAGTKFGTGTTQLMSFWNATPTTQIAGSTDVLAGLVTVGLRAASSNPPLNLGSGTLTAGASTLGATTVTTLGTGGNVTLATGNNLVLATSGAGTQIGTGATQLLGFYGATAVAQPSGSTDVLASLVTLGLRAASSNPALNLGTGLVTDGGMGFGGGTAAAGQITGSGATVTVSTPLLDLSQTWNTGATTFTGAQIVITNTSSNAASVGLSVTGAPITSPGNGATSERFGANSLAAGATSCAFGNGASSSAADTVAVGRNAVASAAGAVTIGSGITNSSPNGVVIGKSAASNATNDGIAIGSGANANTKTQHIAIGSSAAASGDFSIALGRNAAAGTGDDAIAIGRNTTASGTRSIAIGQGASSTVANQMVVGSSGTSKVSLVCIGGGVTSTTASTEGTTYFATGGSGSDNAGASLTFASGKGTGAAASGDILLQSGFILASSSTAQTLYDRDRVCGKVTTCSTTTGTANSIISMSTVSNSSIGGEFSGVIDVEDGSNHVSSITFRLLWSASNRNGTVTATAGTAEVVVSDTTTFTSLTTTVTAVVSSTAVLLKVTPSWSGGTPTIVRCEWRSTSHGPTLGTVQ